MSDDSPPESHRTSTGSQGERTRALASQWRLQRRESAVDEAIRRAQEEGAFDNLPGKGRPLRWETAADDEWWLTFRLLRNAGYAPEWIERAKEVAALDERLAQLVSRGAVAEARQAASELNRLIDSLNLSVPVGALQRRRVDVEALLAQAGWG